MSPPSMPARSPRSPSSISPRMSPRQRIGHAAEQRALDYLLSRGLRLVARNFSVRQGELDLVMADGAQLVFIEVRQRASASFGGAAASVTAAKRQRVRRAAQAFLLASRGDRSWPATRFDVVAIDDGRIDWIRAAF